MEGESLPTPSADDKENASCNDKKKKQKKKRMQNVIIIVCILALVAFLLIAYLASTPEFEIRNKMTTTIVEMES